LVAGTDVSRLVPHRVCASGVAIVPEGRRVFAQMTVADNLALGAYRPAARREHRATLARVQALLARPTLLLLDEPSLGLAPVVVDEVYAAIAAIAESGVSVLVVEQDVPRALAVSQRAYLLSEGRVATTGTPAELTDSAEVRRTVLGL